MNVNVHFFGVAHDLTECREEPLTIRDNATIADILNALTVRHPRLSELGTVLRVAVNQEYMPMDATVCSEDEVAIIPPVSGG